MVTDRIEIQLVYEGEDLNDGSMEVEDAILALRGFAGAYGHIARTIDPSAEHRLHLTAIQEGSITFDLIATSIIENLDTIEPLLDAAANAIGVISSTLLFELINLKVQLRGENHKASAEDNRIAVTKSDNTTINVDRRTYNFLGTGALDKHLDDCTKPLEKDGIDAAEYRVTPNEGAAFSQRIDAADRPFFEAHDGASIDHVVMELAVIIVSYTKNTQKGFLYLIEHAYKRVPFIYVGDNPTGLLAMFATYHEAVKVQCTARVRSDTGIRHVTIHDFDPMQPLLFGIKPLT